MQLLLLAQIKSIRSILTPNIGLNIAFTRPLIFGLNWFCQLINFILEGDSLQVVQAFKDQGRNFRTYGQVVDDAKSIRGRMWSWMSCHVKRDANMAAHGVAKFGLSCPS
jgi:hypothetical protein